MTGPCETTWEPHCLSWVTACNWQGLATCPLGPTHVRRCLEICTEGMLGIPQTPDFEEDAWKREDNLPALLAYTLEKNVLVAREEHRVREEARAEELRRLALAELEVSSPMLCHLTSCQGLPMSATILMAVPHL